MLILSRASLIIAVNFRTFLDTFFSAKKKAKMRQKKAQIWAKFKGLLGQLEDDGRKDPFRAGN